MRVAGKTHCHAHSRPAFGYFRARAVGSATQPAPAATSSTCWARAASRCVASSALVIAGSIVTRSLSPLPPRTTIRLAAKSTPWTRRWQHSRTRSPRAVEQAGHEPGHTVEPLEHRTHLVARENDG